MVYLLAHAECATPQPYSFKKLFEFVQISRPTLAEVGWVRAVAALRQVLAGPICPATEK